MQYDHEADEAQAYIANAQANLRADNLKNRQQQQQRQHTPPSQWKRPKKSSYRRKGRKQSGRANQDAKIKDDRPMFERWGGGLASWLEFFAFAVFALVSLLGLISVALVDVTFGSVSLGAIFANGIPVGDDVVSPLTMALFVSIATSGVQSVVWTLVTQQVKDNRARGAKGVDWSSPTLVAGLIFALVLIVTDTMIDVSVLSFAVYGDNPLDHTFSGHGLIFTAAEIIVGLITSCSELLVALLIVIVRSMAQEQEYN